MLLNDNPSLSSFRNAPSGINLGIPWFSIFEPEEAPTSTLLGKTSTIWDMLHINEGRDILLVELLSIFKERYHTEVQILLVFL
jgi:hypothetical protein